MKRIGHIKMIDLTDLDDEWKCLSVWKYRSFMNNIDVPDLKIFEMNRYKSHNERKYTITLHRYIKIDGVDEIWSN
jgi:hypothetical protein